MAEQHRADAPATYKNEDESVIVRLNHKPGDLAIVAMRSPENAKAVAVFLYDDNSVNVLGCQNAAQTLEIIEMLGDTLRFIKEKGIG